MMYFRVAIGAVVFLLGAALLAVLVIATKEPADGPLSKFRQRSGDAFIAVGGSIMLLSGCLKFAYLPLVVAEMTSLGMTGWKLELVASLEVLSGLLFLVPRLRSLGLPLASAYLGAAVAAHIRSDQYFAVFPTMAIVGCCWLGAALRHPHLLWSLAMPDSARPSLPDERAILAL